MSEARRKRRGGGWVVERKWLRRGRCWIIQVGVRETAFFFSKSVNVVMCRAYIIYRSERCTQLYTHTVYSRFHWCETTGLKNTRKDFQVVAEQQLEINECGFQKRIILVKVAFFSTSKLIDFWKPLFSYSSSSFDMPCNKCTICQHTKGTYFA